jgi:hypothetical protein
MSSTRARGAPDQCDGAPVERDTGHWTTETLPLAVRKQLLERELSQLGFRKAGQGGSARESGAISQQQQQAQESGNSRPKAAVDPGARSGRGD